MEHGCRCYPVLGGVKLNQSNEGTFIVDRCRVILLFVERRSEVVFDGGGGGDCWAILQKSRGLRGGGRGEEDAKAVAVARAWHISFSLFHSILPSNGGPKPMVTTDHCRPFKVVVDVNGISFNYNTSKEAQNLAAKLAFEYFTGEKELFSLAPPHQGIDGEWTDHSGVIVYNWNERSNRPNTGSAN